MYSCGGRMSTVGIATRYGEEASCVETRWVRYEAHSSKPSPNQTSLLYSEYQDCFLGVKGQGRGVDQLVPSNADLYFYPYPLTCVFIACNTENFKFMNLRNTMFDGRRRNSFCSFML